MYVRTLNVSEFKLSKSWNIELASKVIPTGKSSFFLPLSLSLRLIFGKWSKGLNSQTKPRIAYNYFFVKNSWKVKLFFKLSEKKKMFSYLSKFDHGSFFQRVLGQCLDQIVKSWASDQCLQNRIDKTPIISKYMKELKRINKKITFYHF